MIKDKVESLLKDLAFKLYFLWPTKDIFFLKIVAFYKNHLFIKANGSYFMETIASSIYTKELEAFDYKFIAKNQTQTNNISVYESCRKTILYQ